MTVFPIAMQQPKAMSRQCASTAVMRTMMLAMMVARPVMIGTRIGPRAMFGDLNGLRTVVTRIRMVSQGLRLCH